MKHRLLLLALAGCAILAGCASDGSDDKGPAPEPAQVKTLSVEGLSDDQWVYISLETGRKIGTSPLGDAAQDAAWKARTDWDIALCGELIPDQRRHVGQRPGSRSTGPEQEFQCARPGACRRLHDRYGRHSHPAVNTSHHEKTAPFTGCSFFVLRDDGSVLLGLVGEIALLHITDILLHSAGHHRMQGRA